MILLKESDYNKVIGPLQAVTINDLFALTVLELKVPGKVFVDDIENPTTFYILHPYGMSLLFGSTENVEFNEQLFDYLTNKRNERNEIEWLQVFPTDVWSKKITSIFGKHLIETDNKNPNYVIANTRVNFKFNTVQYNSVKHQFKSNEHAIVRVDEKIYAREGSVVPKYFWRDAEQFLKEGIGFSLLCDEKIASTAYSSFIIGRQLELGIETTSEFRGRGFAAIVCSRLIDYCLENGFEPIWSCRLENTASFKLAQKLGFQPTKYLPYYKLNGSPRKVSAEQSGLSLPQAK